MCDTELNTLEVIQNEGMLVILGCPKDTLTEAMRYVLDLPTMSTRFNLAQVKASLKVSANSKPALSYDFFTKCHIERPNDIGSYLKVICTRRVPVLRTAIYLNALW